MLLGPYARSLIKKHMVRIENPIPGKRGEISVSAGEVMIAAGGAVATCRVDGLLHMIRLIDAKPGSNKALTGREYDLVQRSFHLEAKNLPLIAVDKMIREEKSTRDWSYQAATNGLRRGRS